MSKATVYAAAQFGIADVSTATGLLVGSVNFNGSADTAESPNHIGCVVGFAVYNMRNEVSCDGVVKTKGTGLVGKVGALLTLAEATNNSRTKLSEGIDVTPGAGASIILTGSTLSPTQTGFEGGGLSGVYHPFVNTGSPTTLT
jgi:hypothetical protein